MTDKMTPEQRHRCMASVHSKDTKPEMLVRRYLFGCGFRYRLHVRSLPGSPDIVLAKYKTAIFVNGCFWHGHEGCPLYRIPKSNVAFWRKKIKRNQERDKKEYALLRVMGWRVLVIWECQLRSAVRKETLSGLSYVLSVIMLDKYRIKGCGDNDHEDLDLAAESEVEYSKRNEEKSYTKIP